MLQKLCYAFSQLFGSVSVMISAQMSWRIIHTRVAKIAAHKNSVHIRMSACTNPMHIQIPCMCESHACMNPVHI